MKKLILGNGIIMFAILFRLCSSGLDLAALIIGVVGLGVCISGITDTSN